MLLMSRSRIGKGILTDIDTSDIHRSLDLPYKEDLDYVPSLHLALLNLVYE